MCLTSYLPCVAKYLQKRCLTNESNIESTCYVNDLDRDLTHPGVPYGFRHSKRGWVVVKQTPSHSNGGWPSRSPSLSRGRRGSHLDGTHLIFRWNPFVRNPATLRRLGHRSSLHCTEEAGIPMGTFWRANLFGGAGRLILGCIRLPPHKGLCLRGTQRSTGKNVRLKSLQRGVGGMERTPS